VWYAVIQQLLLPLFMNRLSHLLIYIGLVFRKTVLLCNQQYNNNNICECVILIRYYAAEGVKLHSQETWSIITKGKGKQLVEDNIDSVVCGTVLYVVYFSPNFFSKIISRYGVQVNILI